jgi:carbon storage regulator
MLILTRKPGESLYIGDDVKVTIVEIKGNQIRVGIEAPRELRIYREEIYAQIVEENRSAADVRLSGSALETLSGGWKGGSPGGAPSGKKVSSMKGVAVAPTQTQVFVKRKRSRSSGGDGQEDLENTPDTSIDASHEHGIDELSREKKGEHES